VSSPRLRLGLVIYGSLETHSGGYLYDRRLVEYLRRQGDQVEVVSLPWKNYPAHLGQNLLPGLRQRLERLEVDILLQDELNHPSLFLLNRSLRRKVSYRLVSIVHHLRSCEDHPVWVKALYRQVEQSYLAEMDGFLCNSHATWQSVQDLLPPGSPRPWGVAYPGGDRLNPQISQEEISRRAHARGPLEILFAGNLIPRKGMHILVRTLSRLPQTSWRLTAAGSLEADSAYTRSIRRQIRQAGLENNIRLLGQVSDAELAALMRQAHVLAVPSSYEGFGIVYLEAMGFGLPVLASPNGGARELVTPGENGFLVPQDPAGLATRLSSLAEDRQLLCTLGQAARLSYLSRPGWEASMQAGREFLLRMRAEH
jgi:glycosyltransferase involved in cell wall biosynthesis